MTIDLKQLTSLAREFLGPTEAETFIGLARPAIALRRATSAFDRAWMVLQCG